MPALRTRSRTIVNLVAYAAVLRRAFQPDRDASPWHVLATSRRQDMPEKTLFASWVFPSGPPPVKLCWGAYRSQLRTSPLQRAPRRPDCGPLLSPRRVARPRAEACP